MSIKVESAQREAIKTELINNHDAAPVGRVISSPEVSVDDMKGLSPDEKAKFRAAITAQKANIGDTTYNALEDLLKEAEKAPLATVAPAPSTPTATPAGVTILGSAPKEIADAAGSARTAVNKAFGSPWDANYKEYLSDLRRAVAMVPGYEPSSQKDIGDAIYQSREFNLGFITWLEWEAAKDTNSFDTKEKWSGMYSFIGEKTTFSSVEEKRKVIKSMITGLAEAIVKPDIQAGFIERFLWEDLGKKIALTIWGTLAVWVIWAVLVYQGGKWVLKKALGATGAAIAWAIATGAAKGWIGTKNTVSASAQWDGLKWRAARAAVGAAAWAATWAMVWLPWTWAIVGWVGWALRSKPIIGGSSAATPAWTPGAGPSAWPAPTVAYRELDMKQPREAAIHNTAIESIYKAQNGGIAPTPDQAKNLAESIKTNIASPNEIAEYQSRVSRALSIPQPPLGDATKMAEYNAETQRAAQWEKPLKNWYGWAKKPTAWATAASDVAFRASIAKVVNDATSEKVVIWSTEIEVRVGAKTPIEEATTIIDQIAEEKVKIKELEAAQKKLILRLKDEKLYAETRTYLTTADRDIQAAKTAWDQAVAKAAHEKSINNESAQYRTDIAEAGQREVEYMQDKEKKVTAKTTKTTLETKYTDINRWAWITINAAGSVDSTTMEKINRRGQANPKDNGVKEKILQAQANITALEGQLNTKLTTLHALEPKIPTTWNNAGISIGTTRISNLSTLIEALAKAVIKVRA